MADPHVISFTLSSSSLSLLLMLARSIIIDNLLSASFVPAAGLKAGPNYMLFRFYFIVSFNNIIC